MWLARSSYISWCLRAWFVWCCEFFLHCWMCWFGFIQTWNSGNVDSKAKEIVCAILPNVRLLLERLWPKQPSPSSSSRTTCPRAVPTSLASHRISWVSPTSSDLVTKCLPDLLSGKNSCYSWHIQMPVQISGTPLWGVCFIFLWRWRSRSVKRRKTMKSQNVTGVTGGN